MYINKKKLILIILSILLSLPIYANTNDTLSKIENNLFGFDYSNDKAQNRVSRLEKTIYGKSLSGDINKRITKLSADISADVIGNEVTPSRDTFLAEENAKEEGNVDYPIVNEIEMKLFNKTYKNRDFHTRIVTIERKLFGKIYDVDDYSTRMDRIKTKMYPETLAKSHSSPNNEEVIFDREFIKSDDLAGTKHNRFSMPFGQKKYTRPYTNYGDYSGINDAFTARDNLSDELTQMEYDAFGTEFSSDDTNTRIKRLNSANKAKKSSHKYDSQKFSQHMSTAMEIGAMILMILAMVL